MEGHKAHNPNGHAATAASARQMPKLWEITQGQQWICATCNAHPGKCACTWNDYENGIWNKHDTGLKKWASPRQERIPISQPQSPPPIPGPSQPIYPHPPVPPQKSHGAKRLKKTQIDFDFINNDELHQVDWIIIDPDQFVVNGQGHEGAAEIFKRCKGH